MIYLYTDGESEAITLAEARIDCGLTYMDVRRILARLNPTEEKCWVSQKTLIRAEHGAHVREEKLGALLVALNHVRRQQGKKPLHIFLREEEKK